MEEASWTVAAAPCEYDHRSATHPEACGCLHQRPVVLAAPLPVARRAPRRPACAALTILSAALWGPSAHAHCFVPLPDASQPLPEAPFSEEAVEAFRGFFLSNFNYDGTGAIVASPGEVPALESYHVEGGYKYEWVRDSALSVDALLKIASSSVGHIGQKNHITQEHVDKVVPLYLERVERIMTQWREADPQTEPRWGLYDLKPYSHNWCTPQTDGAALRAQALLQYAWRTTSPLGKELAWRLARADLDWYSDPLGRNANLPSCDLWEESMQDDNLLWNRLAARLALQLGIRYAVSAGDMARAERYNTTLVKQYSDVFGNHLKSGKYGQYISECTEGPSPCMQRGGDIDGATILGLAHSGWLDVVQDDLVTPTSPEVAFTVQAYNEEFCKIFPINMADSLRGTPGILYGRYSKDGYGGGNPWVLITASLASLFYQAAQSIGMGYPVTSASLAAWKHALWKDFSGTGEEFIAAGDAVLLRIKAHVEGDGWHLFEQLHKSTGAQYNARDITWSYAEVLLALRERDEALVRLAEGVHWQ